MSQSPRGVGSLDARIAAASAAVLPSVVAWRRDVHQHPELGNREHRTAALVADHLRALGLDEVRTGVAHTGVVGLLRGGKPGPVVALRADMDALPVVEEVDLPFASKVKAISVAQAIPSRRMPLSPLSCFFLITSSKCHAAFERSLWT